VSDGAFDPKHPSASDVFAVDFAADLAAGETLTGATFAIAAVVGIDAAASSMLSGAASVVGTQARQRIVGGVAGVTYDVRAVVTTSAGSTKVGCATLRVEAC
jgi:hypothetical protein